MSEADEGRSAASALPAPQSGDEALVRDILDVERQRLEAENRRAAVMEKALELEADRDRRGFEFATASRDQQIELSRDRHAFLRRLVWTFVGAGALFFFALVGIYLFGTEPQRESAWSVLSPLVIGIAGYGVIMTLTRVVKAFTTD